MQRVDISQKSELGFLLTAMAGGESSCCKAILTRLLHSSQCVSPAVA
jgi:hypothetical protein